MTEPLGVIAGWGHAAAGAVIGKGRGVRPSVIASVGRSAAPFKWASVTKVLTAMALWIAWEEGTVSWDEPAGPPGATLSDLLSHASGLAPDDDRILAAPRTRRIYSNRGIEVASGHLAARAGMPFGEYLSVGLLEPLGMTGVRLIGSPAYGATGSLEDLIKLGVELLAPSLISPEGQERCVRVSVPGLAGVLPGFGRQASNDWGLGVEVRDHKSPHWTGRTNSPSTFGHFGQSGSFLWVDPQQGLALATLSARSFGPWAAEAWPRLSDAVIAEYGIS
ncbi:MAG TPA: serine hydrolase domain-containing protein [Acidimicrobiales bacterium]|nr:serine hydrolase domain-containing protein [Acidimicrobiales bacterium]